MTSLLSKIALAGLLGLGACAMPADEGYTPIGDKEDSSEVIEWRLPAAPTAIELRGDEASFGQSIAFGHCNPSETDADGVTNVECPKKWSEVAWFEVSQEDVRGLMAQGLGELAFDLTIEDSLVPGDDLRFSVHQVAEDGTTRKILSEPNLGHEESATVALGDFAYYVYLARGDNNALVWANGFIEFSVAAQGR